MKRGPALAALAMLAGSSGASASASAGASAGATPELRAARRTGRLTCDGRLDEAAWREAPVFDDFVASSPHPGTPPSERTEVRVLYDDQHVYVGITAFDRRPAEVSTHLGPRDAPPVSDLVSVALDTRRDGRNAYSFAVNAGGVQRDGLWVDDGRWVPEWDAVWCGEAALDPRGWTAEFEIPLHLLRFSDAEAQRWGIGVRREHARTHEVLDSALVPPLGTAMVSRFAVLEDLVGLSPRRAIMLAPYVGVRLLRSPAISPVAPTLDVGADLEANLGSTLQLTATLNPDYGQLEADEAVLNLSTFETFLTERRPFFLRSLELFEPIDPEAPRLFYSRRIGGDAPILAAAKLTGAIGRLQLGIIDAVVAGPQLNASDGISYQAHLERPLHLGPAAEAPSIPPVSRNYLAGSARAAATEVLTLGAQLVATVPLSSPCHGADVPDDADCRAPLASGAAAIHADARADSWVALAQLHGSVVSRGPDGGSVLRDGTSLRAGDLGSGGLLRIAREGGEPWRFEVAAHASSPRLQLDQLGYLRAGNEADLQGKLGYVRTDLARLAALSSELHVLTRTTADGRAIPLGTDLTWETEASFTDASLLGLQLRANVRRRDVREIEGTGISFERPAYGQVLLYGNTDPGRAGSLQATVYAGRSARLATTPIGDAWFGGAELAAVWRPREQAETRLTLSATRDTDGPRWISVSDGEALFAELIGRSLSATLRQLVVLRKELTLQGYVQLFTVSGTYGPAYRARLADELDLAALALATDVVPGFHGASLDTSLVLRWDYQPGSSAHVVYARHQEEATDAPAQADLGPGLLLSGPSSHVVLVKWSRLWSL
jgi:hypothetical protein